MTTTMPKRSLGELTTLDQFLEEEGILDEVRLITAKRVLAWQLEQAMTERKLTKVAMAKLMDTSRAQLDRLLDPAAGNVTLETLARAAKAVGRRLSVELV